MSSDVLSGILTLSIVLSACSVKEDRTVCPCRLSLVFRGGTAAECYEKLHFFVEDPTVGFVNEGDAGFGEAVRLNVERTSLSVYAWAPAECGKGYEIPVGEMCPRLFYCHGQIDARGEGVSDTLVLHKNYAELKIILGGVDVPAREGIYAEITSAVSGYDREGAPIPGAFRTKQTFAESGECSFCLPRQADDSSELKIICPGGPEFVFPLGLFLRERGYDWAKEDLEDISLHLDYCTSTVTVVEGLWNKVVSLDVSV